MVVNFSVVLFFTKHSGAFLHEDALLCFLWQLFAFVKMYTLYNTLPYYCYLLSYLVLVIVIEINLSFCGLFSSLNSLRISSESCVHASGAYASKQRRYNVFMML